MEAALLVGWPVGWALASFRFTEVGEARVLQTLGEAPHQTVARLAPHGALFAAALAAVALVYGHDATAPGRVATELLSRGRSSCESVRSPATSPVPFTDMTWLCAPGRGPRLVGPGPGGLDAVVLTAADARIAGDFRAIELDDARILTPGETPLVVRAGSLEVHGMAPWARASTLAPAVRALVLATAGWLVSMLVAYLVLAGAARTRRRSHRRARDDAIARAGSRRRQRDVPRRGPAGWVRRRAGGGPRVLALAAHRARC
jgi:hypothetical protein